MGVTLDTPPDFGGWATKAGLDCADGLTIGHDAFKDMDGVKVPLVYQHGHNEIGNVLGHAILENRGEGVYAHCYFNTSDNAKKADAAVQHEDLTQLSIYANRLRKNGNTVIHGIIREVSLVMAGANPGALIDFVAIRHGDGGFDILEDEAIITTGEELVHTETTTPVEDDADTEDNDETDDDTWESMSPKQQDLTKRLMERVAEADVEPEPDPEDADDPEGSDLEPDPDNPEADPAAAEPVETDSAPDASTEDADAAAHSDLNKTDLEGSEMTNTEITHNVFDQDAAIQHGLKGKAINGGYELSHSDNEEIFTAAVRSTGSLADAVEGFKLKHGIDNIDILFPDAKNVMATPEWDKRRTEWVASVLTGTRHTPFSRIKSLSADLTLEAARAKGYIKSALKKEEFFSVAKRVTTPQTVYKKQKLDRDDILDITDFDVVVWIKGEMRLMLDEEIARAVLIGDGRSNADDDKIKEDHIRPIATDHELFQTTVYINLGNAESSSEEIVDAFLLNRRFYKGSGSPTLFTTEIILSSILNVKDGFGRRIYSGVDDLAAVLRVSSIVPVEVMEEQPDLVGIMVNLQDYTIGADRGGDIALFDDFDIDYNQYKWLIETRCSGALTKPKAALVVRRTADNSVLAIPVEPTWNEADHQVTVATTTGVVYKNQANGAILSSGTPVTLADGQTLTVIAVPASSAYYFESNRVDEFTFDYDEGLVNGPF